VDGPSALTLQIGVTDGKSFVFRCLAFYQEH
jgi:hypothetical protein